MIIMGIKLPSLTCRAMLYIYIYLFIYLLIFLYACFFVSRDLYSAALHDMSFFRRKTV